MGQVIFDYFEEFKEAIVQVEYAKTLVSLKEEKDSGPVHSFHVEYREYSELSEISELSDEEPTINPYEAYTCSFIK